MNELDFSEISKLSEKYSRDPQSRIFVQLADVYRKNNMIDEALDVLNKGLAYHPQYPLAYLVLGKCYFDKRAHIQARDAFEKTIALDPQNVVALRMLARTCEMLKDEKGQINAYKSIIALDPLDTNAKEKLSMLEALQRKEPLYTVAMAEEYEKQGNIEESLKIYENLLFTDPSDLILKQKVAELKKVTEERRRMTEGEKIEEMRIETVFKPDEIIETSAPKEAAAAQALPREPSEPTPTVEEGIQSLEDFLVEELEQAAEKVAIQSGDEGEAPEEQTPSEPSMPSDRRIAPAPPGVDETDNKIMETHGLSFGDINLEEPEHEAVATEPEKERQLPSDSVEAAPVVQVPQPQPVEPTTTEKQTEAPVSEAVTPEPKDDKEESEHAKKPKEEDFKSFQEWLSGLLK